MTVAPFSFAKLARPLFFGIVALGLVSCGGSDEAPPAEQAAILDCAYPDAPTVPAPEWICTEFIADIAISAVGSSPKSSAGVDFMVTQATLAARVKLAETIKTEVANRTEQYIGTTGSADSETVDAVAQSTSSSFTNESLRGSRLYKKSTNPDTGHIYVLIGMGDQQLSEAIEKTLNTSYNNDQALWQKALGERSFQALKDEVQATSDSQQ